MITLTRPRKRKAHTLADLTPIAAWILKERLRTLDPHTGEPYSERQISKMAGLDVGAVNRYMHGAIPVSGALYKLAMFFSSPPDHIINPDYLLYLANYHPDPAPELLHVEVHTEEDLDTLVRREDPALYRKLEEILLHTSEANRRKFYEFLKGALEWVLGDE
jgi:transcriptional regulator with XRE-family HTH domain